jgi:hypothetical protein
LSGPRTGQTRETRPRWHPTWQTTWNQ